MTSAERHLRGLARGGSLGLAGSLVSAGATFAVVMVVTSTFEARVAGEFFTLTSFFLLAMALVGMGSETGLGRFMLRFEAHGRRADIRAAIRAGFVPPMIFAVVAGVVCVVAAGPLSRAIGLSGAAGERAFALAGLVLPLVTLGYLGLAGTRAFGRIRTTVAGDNIVRPVGQLAGAWLVGALGGGLVGLSGVWLAAYLVASLIGLLAFRGVLRRRLGSPAEVEQLPAQAPGDTWREYWGYTWARGIARVGQMGLDRLDIILVAVLLGAVEAAIYTAATRFVALGKFPVTAITQVLQPRFTRIVADDDEVALREVFRVSTAWSMAVSWPVYVVVGCAPLVYLSLFGETYQDGGVATVLWLTGGMMLTLLMGPADTLLLMSGRSTASLLNTLAALAIDVVGCLLLIPRLGISGAAISWTLAVGFRSVMSLVLVRLQTDVTSLGRASWWVAGANLAAFAVPVTVLTRLVDLSVPALAGVVVVLTVPYLGVLYLGRDALRLDVLLTSFRRRRAGV